jgi:beta-lactamase regulating signal transducer with metallopeptidase domain
VLTSWRRPTAATKYWIWAATAFNFVIPAGALIDTLWAPHLRWASPLGAIGGPVWDMTQGWTAVVLAALWITGGLIMCLRLVLRIRQERRAGLSVALRRGVRTSRFVVDGVPVCFAAADSAPSVNGILRPYILLPLGIDRVLDQREFRAVLLHEVAHARRRDNLVRLFYEAALCALWFHPLMWLAGARMALYRELSCDESVIRRAHAEALVSALAKLAVPESPRFLQATASSHLTDRLARLETAQRPARSASVMLASVFAGILLGGIVETVAHTACCFLLTR